MEQGLSRGNRARPVLRAGYNDTSLVRGSGGEGPYERSFRLFPCLWPSVAALVNADLLLRSRQRGMALDARERAAGTRGESCDVQNFCPRSTQGNGKETSADRGFK